jgi:hypothetical protein
MVVGLSGIGFLRAYLSHKNGAQLQLKMDRCTAHAALNISRMLKLMHESNMRKKAYLATSPASLLLPPVAAAVKAGLKAESAFQKIIKMRWTAEQSKWLIRADHDCPKGFENLYSNFPAFPFAQELPTPFGPGPALYQGLKPDTLQVRQLFKASSAKIFNPAIANNQVAWVQ